MSYAKFLFKQTNWVVVLGAFFVVLLIVNSLGYSRKYLGLVMIPSLAVGALGVTRYYFEKYRSYPLLGAGELFFTYLMLIIPLTTFGALIAGVVGEFFSVSSMRDRGLIGGFGVLCLLFWVLHPKRKNWQEDTFYHPDYEGYTEISGEQPAIEDFKKEYFSNEIEDNRSEEHFLNFESKNLNVDPKISKEPISTGKSNKNIKSKITPRKNTYCYPDIYKIILGGIKFDNRLFLIPIYELQELFGDPIGDFYRDVNVRLQSYKNAAYPEKCSQGRKESAKVIFHFYVFVVSVDCSRKNLSPLQASRAVLKFFLERSRFMQQHCNDAYNAIDMKSQVLAANNLLSVAPDDPYSDDQSGISVNAIKDIILEITTKAKIKKRILY